MPSLIPLTPRSLERFGHRYRAHFMHIAFNNRVLKAQSSTKIKITRTRYILWEKSAPKSSIERPRRASRAGKRSRKRTQRSGEDIHLENRVGGRHSPAEWTRRGIDRQTARDGRHGACVVPRALVPERGRGPGRDRAARTFHWADALRDLCLVLSNGPNQGFLFADF